MAEGSEKNKSKTRHQMPGEYVYEGMVFCDGFDKDAMERIRASEFREGDVIVVTYPKCGTTWMESILDLAVNAGDMDVVNSDYQDVRIPFIETVFEGGQVGLDLVQSRPAPRLMKCHLQAKFFEKALEAGKAKFIVVTRNPKDALVSYYNMYCKDPWMGPYTAGWDTYFEDLVRGDHLIYGDFFTHVRGWAALKDHPNVIFFSYEEMHRNLHKQVERLAKFLGLTLSPEVVDTIVRNTSFSKMKINKMVNKSQYYDETPQFSFMRKGVVGDHKNYFNEEQSAYIDEKCQELYKDSGIEFEFQLE